MVSSWQNEKKQKRYLKVVWDREREKEKLQREIDELLDKIRMSGIDSLTAEERDLFRKVSKKIEDMENKE